MAGATFTRFVRTRLLSAIEAAKEGAAAAAEAGPGAWRLTPGGHLSPGLFASPQHRAGGAMAAPGAGAGAEGSGSVSRARCLPCHRQVPPLCRGRVCDVSSCTESL